MPAAVERSLKKAAKRYASQGVPKGKKAKRKIRKTLHEYKEGTLHSGSKHGPLVKNRKQAIAIAINQARRAE